MEAAQRPQLLFLNLSASRKQAELMSHSLQFILY